MLATRHPLPHRGLDKFVLGLPEGMRDKVGVAARTNKRTMNAEIVQRLEASFSSTDEPLLVIKKNTPTSTSPATTSVAMVQRARAVLVGVD